MTARDDGINQFAQIRALEASLSGLRSCQKRLEKLDLTRAGAREEKLRRQLKVVTEAIEETEQRLAQTKETTTMGMATSRFRDEISEIREKLARIGSSKRQETKVGSALEEIVDLTTRNVAKLVTGDESNRSHFEPLVKERVGKLAVAKGAENLSRDYLIVRIAALVDEVLEQQAEEARKAGFKPNEQTDLSGAAAQLGREAPGLEEAQKAAGMRAIRNPLSQEQVVHTQHGRQAGRDMIAAARRIWASRNTH